MARYDVHDVRGLNGAESLVVVQDAFYDFMESRLAIPLFSDLTLQIDDVINPAVGLKSRHLLLKTEFLGSVSAHRLGQTMGSLKDKHYEISRAIDRLMTGF